MQILFMCLPNQLRSFLVFLLVYCLCTYRDMNCWNVGQGSDASRSLYEGQRSDSKIGLEKQAIRDPRAQACQEEMETGYEDNTLPQTFEGLEQKFLHDIMKLAKEQQDAEDAENARHRGVS